MSLLVWVIFIAAAVLEVSGDAIVRTGLRYHQGLTIAGGFLMLGCYGLVVNMVRWDFSRLLGTYVAIFAAVSVLFGMWVFGETVPLARWLGLALIIAGGLIIQFAKGA